MSLLIHAHDNILESSAVTLTAGTADASYPLWRIYDRDVGKAFRATTATTTTIHADQGASPVAATTLIIASGHNVSGLTLTLQRSSDDSSWTTAVTFTATSGQMAQTFASATYRYWRLTIASPATAVQLTEVWLCSTYTWLRNPSRPTGQMDSTHNVVHATTAAGHDRWLVMGASKRRRKYAGRCVASQATALQALDTAWAGAYPFWLCDHDGTWIFGRLDSPMDINESSAGNYTYLLDFIEVVA